MVPTVGKSQTLMHSRSPPPTVRDCINPAPQVSWVFAKATPPYILPYNLRDILAKTLQVSRVLRSLLLPKPLLPICTYHLIDHLAKVWGTIAVLILEVALVKTLLRYV